MKNVTETCYFEHSCSSPLEILNAYYDRFLVFLQLFSKNDVFFVDYAWTPFVQLKSFLIQLAFHAYFFNLVGNVNFNN